MKIKLKKKSQLSRKQDRHLLKLTITEKDNMNAETILRLAAFQIALPIENSIRS